MAGRTEPSAERLVDPYDVADIVTTDALEKELEDISPLQKTQGSDWIDYAFPQSNGEQPQSESSRDRKASADDDAGEVDTATVDDEDEDVVGLSEQDDTEHRHHSRFRMRPPDDDEPQFVKFYG